MSGVLKPHFGQNLGEFFQKISPPLTAWNHFLSTFFFLISILLLLINLLCTFFRLYEIGGLVLRILGIQCKLYYWTNYIIGPVMWKDIKWAHLMLIMIKVGCCSLRYSVIYNTALSCSQYHWILNMLIDENIKVFQL